MLYHFVVPNWRVIIKRRFWSRGSAQFIKGLFLKKSIILQRVNTFCKIQISEAHTSNGLPICVVQHIY